MISESYENGDRELVMDALLWRGEPSEASESCFIVNTAGVALIKSGANVLPAVEGVLEELVVPELAVNQAQGNKFRGLSYVLCAYAVIGMRVEPQRVISFLEGRSRRLLQEFIKSVPMGFQWTNEGYNFGSRPTRELLDYLEQLALASDKELQLAAQSALKKLAQSEVRRQKQETSATLGTASSVDSRGRVHKPGKRSEDSRMPQ